MSQPEQAPAGSPGQPTGSASGAQPAPGIPPAIQLVTNPSKDQPVGTVQPVVAPDVASVRRKWGYGLMVTSLVLLCSGFAGSLAELCAFKPQGTTVGVIDYVLLGVHAAVTLAFMYFCYCLLQAAERLAIPAELVRTSEDIRLLLGVKPPAGAATEELRKLVESGASLLRSLLPKEPK